MNILIISYFSLPDCVGSKRILYWEEYLSNLGIPVTVWTAQNMMKTNFIHIPDNKSSIFSYFIKDAGVAWKKSIADHIINDDLENYTHIILTGGPFMHFGIIRELRKHSNAKIILDYRDPFAYNPRFNNSKIKILIKSYFENSFNRSADAILVVNDYMKNCLKHPNVHVIENGYDEKLFNAQGKTISSNGIIRSIYAGSLYSDRFQAAATFLDVIRDKPGILFKYFGNNHQKINGYSDNILASSSIPYPKMVLELYSSDVGLIFTKGYPFESTTKIYDYIGANLKILIITQGKKETGSMHEITKDYPNVYWADDHSDDINKSLNILMSKPTLEFDASKFSREYNTLKVISYLNTI
jgi:hypothetical protein